jgi:hypothetical protein
MRKILYYKLNKREMKSSFINDCLFFRSKEKLHRFLGVYSWVNIIYIIITVLSLVEDLK